MTDHSTPTAESEALAFLAGGGEMGARTRAFDWATTPVGPVASWPQSLKIAVRIMLDSRYAMWLGWGPDFTFFYNDAYARMTLGPKHPWALGRSAREVWAEIWGDIGPRAEKVIATGEATWDEGLLLFLERRGFAEETYHTFSYSPIPTDRGEVGGMLCVVTEDTERTIGERRLRTLRELAARTLDESKSVEEACQSAARTLGDNSRDLPFVLIYLLDENTRTARLVGRTGLPEGSPAAPAVVDLSQHDAGWPLRSVLESGTAQVVPDLGSRFGPLPGGAWPEPPQQAVVVPMARPGQAQAAGFVVAGVSPRLVLTDDYRGFLDLLAGHVGTTVSNARAYEEERRRAEALAEIDRVKTAFFSNVSHEFRTPLTLILGPVEDLLARSPSDLEPGMASHLEVVHRNGLRLMRLVNTLLDFSRMEAGRVRAIYQPTDLAAFTADLASNFRSACDRAGLRLVVDCPALPQPVFVDREMWEKIVLNLVSNAFKFTFEGEIAVSLHPGEHAVELRVRDTGTGIPAEELPRLFERFHRVQNARGRTHEGSGIGLALVQELIKLHGGTVHAESTLGQGTTFFVRVPLGTGHLPHGQIGDGQTMAFLGTGATPYLEEVLRWLPYREQERPDAELPSVPEPLSTPHHPVETDGQDERPRVLVADDNADMRQYVVRLLTGQFRVEAVADGEAALAAVRKQPPDLVLTDVMMPKLTGFGLLQALRADPRTRGLPIIMLSARAGEESRVEGMEAGADDYLVKPFSARELLARVSAHLQIARLRREAERAVRESEERLRLALTAARMVAWEYDPATDLVTVSDNLAELYGLPPGTTLVSAQQGYQLIHPDDAARHRTRVMTALEECGSYLSQFRLIRPDDGRIIWLEERGHCINDETGKPARLVGVVMDISERIKAEEELRQRAEEVQTLLDTLPIGIFVAHDPEGRTITGNQAALALLRSPASRNLSLSAPAEEKPTHFRVLRNAVELAPEQLPVQRAARGELVENEELEVVFDDGHVINEVISAAPLFDPQGRVRGAVAGVLDITDRKRAEQQLHEERDRLRVTLTSIGDAVITTDTEGRITFLNGVAETLTGWANAEAAGLLLEEVFRIINEDTRLPVENPATRALREGVIVGLANHTLLLRRDGTELPIDDSAAPVTDGQGQVVGCVLVFRDVTERRKAEAALRESEAHFRTMADNAPTMLWVTDPTGSCVYLSKSWHAYTGRTPEQDLGFGWLDNVHPDDLSLAEETFRSANTRRVPFSVDYRLRRYDGQYFWHVDAGQPRFDEHGHFQGFVGTVTDIHARRVAEAALRDRTAQLDLTLSATGVGMWLNTLPLGDLNWDARTCELFFLPPGVKPTIDLFWSRLHPNDHQLTRQAMEAALKNGSVYAVDHRVVHPHTGEIRWVRSTGQATYNEAGVAIRFDGINYDITERKLLEEELRRVAAELSEANSKKDEFLATLAHELRNPLAPIRNGLQVLKLTGTSAGAVEQARGMMERQLEQMVRLVDDLMDVSRITRGKVELRKERVQVAVAVNSALEACRPLIELMNHDLSITMPPYPVTVDADLTRLAQVFANLLNNAAKYTERGGRISLTVERQANDVVVSVRDTGIGIPPDKLISIFDMFSQVDRSLEKAQGGLGIGLTLVRRLVEMHGGAVEARSEGPGRGAEFVVRLPTIEETVAAPSDYPPHLGARKSSLRILVVDDNRDGADTLSMMLRILGNETHTAYDGQEGVEQAERVRPHVILFDIGLPRLNGYEACRFIRRQDWGKSMVLFAVTGWGQDEDRRRSQEAGFDYHLVKPVDPEVLLKLLAELPVVKK